MSKLLVLFAHPAFERSRVHAELVRSVKGLSQLTFHDLYEAYPHHDIDVAHEQRLLLEHDIIIWQHPFYWYSSPAIIKQWQDLVLTHGWSYGKNGVALQGKRIMNAITCGGPREAYQPGGRNRFTINQLLAPFDQTAALCKMQYLPPFVVHGTHKLQQSQILNHATIYNRFVKELIDDRLQPDQLANVSYANDLYSEPITV